MGVERDNEEVAPESVFKRMLLAAALLTTLGLAAVWFVAWIPAWPCTLFEHFRVQYVAIGVPLVALAAVLRAPRCLDAIAITTLLHLIPIAADLTAAPRRVPAAGRPVRVLLANVLTESGGFAQVRRLIAAEQPDVIGLVEVDRRWLQELAPALAGYAGRIEAPRDDNFGIALYARGAVTGTVEALGGLVPSVVADVALDGAPLRVVVTHPVPPISSDAYRHAERQLEELAVRVRGAAGPVVVLGDLNATPWSRLFVRLVHHTGLCDSRAGFGAQASFPRAIAPLRIPIDHVLVSCSIGVRDRRIGPDVGSDHLPVLVDLILAR